MTSADAPTKRSRVNKEEEGRKEKKSAFSRVEEESNNETDK